MSATHPQTVSGQHRSPPLLAWGLLLVLAAAAAFAALRSHSAGVLDAWLIAFVILSGLVVASLALLMIGHILGDAWLDPIRDELEPAAWTMPIIVVMAVPILLRLDVLFPGVGEIDASTVPTAQQRYLAPPFFTARTIGYLVIWTALAFVVARGGVRKTASVVGLALLAPTLFLAAIDWIVARDPLWWSNLFPVAFTVSQLVAALAAAILITLAMQEHFDYKRFRSLEKALLTLALLTFWVWFSQFLVVWMADLPNEAQWYLRRVDGRGWGELGVALPALLIAIALLIPPKIGRWRLLVASVLVLVHHFAYMPWLLAPDGRPTEWLAMAVLPALVAIWVAWLVVGRRWHRRLSRPSG